MSTLRKLSALAPLSLLLLTSVALAQSPSDADKNENSATPGAGETPTQANATERVELGVGSDPQSLPAPQSDTDSAPAVAAPDIAAQGITEQAGVGGTQAYGRAGVLELGGFANLTSATNFLSIGFNPTVGWFFMDNVELTAILSINHSSVTTTTPGTPATANTPATPATESDTSNTSVMLLAEPSLHIPFSRTVFGFLGVGFGIASQSADPGLDGGVGFAIAPRLGMNVMVGRSGVFTPALQGVFQTTDAIATPQGTVLAVNSSMGLNLGYTVMW